MAPNHHHYEQKAGPTAVRDRFWIISVMWRRRLATIKLR